MLKELGYAMGGAVDDDEAEDKALVKKGSQPARRIRSTVGGIRSSNSGAAVTSTGRKPDHVPTSGRAVVRLPEASR